MKTISRSGIYALLLLALLGRSALAGESKSFALSSAYKEECGSCHVAYPPGLLPAAAWQTIISGLARHFGSDASLEAAKAKDVARFLETNAARGDKYAALDASGRPLLRITDSAWFRREHRDGHDGISAAVWQLPSVKSAANCAACHRGAEQGDFSERGIRIPRS